MRKLIWWTYGGALLTSTVANVWHAYPSPTGIVVGLILPIGIAATSAIVERGTELGRWFRLGLAALMLTAMVVSFTHISSWAVLGGEDDYQGVLVAVFIDLTMILCGGALLKTRPEPVLIMETAQDDGPAPVLKAEIVQDDGPEPVPAVLEIEDEPETIPALPESVLEHAGSLLEAFPDRVPSISEAKKHLNVGYDKAKAAVAALPALSAAR